MGLSGKINKVKHVLHRLVGVLSAPVVRTPGLFAAMVLMLTAVPWTQYVIIKPGKVAPLAATVQMLSVAMVLVWAVLAVYLLLRQWRRWAAYLWLLPAFVALTADWLIDLGPEGGDGGGNIVCAGTPETVAACGESYTGQYLKKVLER